MIEEIEKILNYSFKDKELLNVALIHKSYNEGSKKDLPDNDPTSQRTVVVPRSGLQSRGA